MSQPIMTSILQLVEPLYHGFGEDFLAAPGGRVPAPELYSVQMMHSDNGGPEEYVGLDDTEFILPPQPDNPRQHVMSSGEVWVYGVIKVESVQWLSEKGAKLLEREIRKKDDEGRPASNYRSRLRLGELFAMLEAAGYAQRPRIVVRFKKRSQVRWPDERQERFLMQSAGNRTYVLRTLHVEAYRRSENWFHRQQMIRLMKQLVRDANPQQPIEGRTIKWFMEQYHIQIRPADLRRRIIFYRGKGEGSDNTIGLDGSLPHDRFLRRLENGDLISRFGEQCEWLLANQIASASAHVKLFDVKEWVDFCRYVQRSRVTHWKQTRQRWGMPPNVKSPYDLVSEDDEFGMERFGGTKGDWKKYLENNLKRKPKPREPEPTLLFSPPPLVKRKLPPPEPAIYDSDFSEPSTAGETDSEDEEPCPPHTISYMSLQRPVMPRNRIRWDCPHRDPSCPFSIDMLELYTKLGIDPVKYASEPKVRDGYEREFRKVVTEHELDVHIPVAIVVGEDGEIHLRAKEEHSRLRRSVRKRPRIKVEGR